jgi:hypothetical protein|tara:strand:- start:51251 stop:52120 length:870 start_codon:yes stop_codon:yes gene_type:complete
MFLEILSKRHLAPSVLSVACIALLSSCNYMDAVHNAMPKGYTHHTTKPISEPRLTHSYDEDIHYNNAEVQVDHILHKDKVDQLLEQIKPTLRTVSPEDSIFLVSEQKNRDFDDALRLSLRNLGMSLDLTSMARYQMIYTIRKAKKDDFTAMSVMPSRDEIAQLKYYALRFVDTAHGKPIAQAYLIPGYHGFKTLQSDTATSPINTAPDMPVAIASPAVRAQPVMDESPMLAPIDDKMDGAYSPAKSTMDSAKQGHQGHYGQVHSPNQAATQQPMAMAITDDQTTDKTAQ